MTTEKEERNKETRGKNDPSSKSKKSKVHQKEEVIEQAEPELKNTVKFTGWEQKDGSVTVTLFSGKRLTANDIDAVFTDSSAKISTTDGRRWFCKFNKPIISTSAKVQTKGPRITLRFNKQDRDVIWKKLEFDPEEVVKKNTMVSTNPTRLTKKSKTSSEAAKVHSEPVVPPAPPPPPIVNLNVTPVQAQEALNEGIKEVGKSTFFCDVDSVDKCEQKNTIDHEKLNHPNEHNEEMGDDDSTTHEDRLYMLDRVKNDFFEKSTTGPQDTMVLHLYVKKPTVDIAFKEQEVVVKFTTEDKQFLDLHDGSTKETTFCWKIPLIDKIQPSLCRHRFTQSMIEITLRKQENKRWGAFEQIRDKGQRAEHQKWLSASNKKLQPVENSDKPVTTQKKELTDPKPDTSNKRVTFDEMSSTATATSSGWFESPSTSRNQKDNKPTCLVTPINKANEPMVNPGYTGLDNLGNTCFMNSVLQVLANTPYLKEYFLDGEFQKEINHENPLGTGGRLAVAFATLLRILWSGKRSSYSPSNLKNLIAMKSSQFSGYAQHDSQEFLAFLLDGLHEDVNRIKTKPYTQTVEAEGKADDEVAALAWDIHKLRNDSIIVDMFQGQYKSTLICPQCNKVSITFDPFMHLSVPLPKKMSYQPVIFISKDPHMKPLKMVLRLSKEGTGQTIREAVQQLTKIPAKNLRVYEVYKNKIHKMFSRSDSISMINVNDIIVVNEVYGEDVAGEKILEFVVSQRAEAPTDFPRQCHNCQQTCRDPSDKLKRCLKCLRVAYCDRKCQAADWTRHKKVCNPVPEPVGSPFIVSLPKSQATYARLCQMLQMYAMYSLNAFQPPPKEVCIEDETSSPEPVSNADSACASYTESLKTQKSTEEGKEDLDPMQMSSTSSTGSSVPDTGVDSLSTSSTSLSTDGGDSPTRELQSKISVGSLSIDSGHATVSCASEPSRDNTTLPEDTKKTRIVLGKQQDAEAPSTKFKVQVCDEYLTRGELLRDLGDEPLPLEGVSYLVMDWKNSGKRTPFVMVESKLEIDSEDHPSVEAALNSTEKEECHLEHCLELFTEPEQLSPEHSWYCPQCKEHREASKQLHIWSLPDVLIIHLKRFSFRTFMWRDKIDKLIKFPIRGLDLNPFMVTSEENQPLYDLYGVVNHYGSMLGGHYTSYVRCPKAGEVNKNQVGWRLCDDSNVSMVTEKQVVTSAAYVLFYQKRGSKPPPLPLMDNIAAQGNTEALKPSTSYTKASSTITNTVASQGDVPETDTAPEAVARSIFNRSAIGEGGSRSRVYRRRSLDDVPVSSASLGMSSSPSVPESSKDFLTTDPSLPNMFLDSPGNLLTDIGVKSADRTDDSDLEVEAGSDDNCDVDDEEDGVDPGYTDMDTVD